jgi:hypothetical protein
MKKTLSLHPRFKDKKVDSSKIALKFERFLFNGVPDHPEHSFERNESANSNVSVRNTGRAGAVRSHEDPDQDLEVWGYFDIDVENETDEFRKVKKL